MARTIEEIVESSHLPMSIIVVGIGKEDFKMMDHLDSDDVLLKGAHSSAVRDIVQFVPFEKFSKNTTENIDAQFLAEEVLEEVPEQVTGYFS